MDLYTKLKARLKIMTSKTNAIITFCSSLHFYNMNQYPLTSQYLTSLG